MGDKRGGEEGGRRASGEEVFPNYHLGVPAMIYPILHVSGIPVPPYICFAMQPKDEDL